MKLDIVSINRLSPYKVTPVGSGLGVTFYTDHGVQYVAGFDKDDSSLPKTEVYQFSIINMNNKRSPRDSKVRRTIISIVENFFKLNNEVMLYICETGDRKQSMRSRLFEYWFNHYRKGWNVLLMDASIYDDAGIPNYAAIIVRMDNPHLAEVTKEFTDTVSLLNNKPGV